MTLSSAASDFEGFDYDGMAIDENVHREVIDDVEHDGDGESLSPSIRNRDDEQREFIIISDDETSSEYDGGILTVETTKSINECSRQVSASDKALHFEEQTTQNTKEGRCIRMSIEDCRHDQSAIIFNDENYSQFDSGIMTDVTTNPITDGCKQVTAFDKVPHFEEQTTQKNTTRWIRRSMKDCRHNLSIISNDEKSFQCDSGIMTAVTTNPLTDGCTQVTAFDKVPHFEEQTTQKNTTRWILRSMKDCRYNLSIISNDDKSSQCDSGIMTAVITNPITDECKQVVASDKVPHFEEQTTQKNTTRWIRRSMKDGRHDLSIITSNDDKSSPLGSGIMTAVTTNPITDGCKQATASDEVPRFEEQATQKNTTRWIRRSMKDGRHDLSIIISNDDKSSPRGSGIMTAVTTNPITDGCKQATASDEVPRLEEQTTQKNTTRWIRRSMKDGRHNISIIISNDDKSSPRGSGIMTAVTTNTITDGCKQVTASDEVPCLEEQTTQTISKDVSDAQPKESKCTHVSVKACKHDQSEKSSQCVGGIMISETTNSLKKCGKQVTWSDKVQNFEEKITQMNTKDADVEQQKESRLDDDVTLIGPRSLSHAMAINKGKKHINYMGSSCRFRSTNTTKVGDIQNKNQKRDEGVSEGTKSMITYSSEIKPISHKEIPVTNYSFKYADKDNNPFMGFPSNQVSYATEKALKSDSSYYLSSASLKSDSKSSSFDWEPTKLYRSEFLISQGVSVPDILFEPNRYSIEVLPKIGDKLSILSSFGTHQSLKVGNLVTAHNGMDMDSKGKKHIGDLVHASEVQNNDRPTQKGDTHRRSKFHRECKPLRRFRAALTESVKGLLKSTWRDGKLTKEAHKQIVKKTVDKVITTLPSKETPNIKDYLTSSETKLLKLVKGYTTKYGKR